MTPDEPTTPTPSSTGPLAGCGECSPIPHEGGYGHCECECHDTPTGPTAEIVGWWDETYGLHLHRWLTEPEKNFVPTALRATIPKHGACRPLTWAMDTEVGHA